MYIIYAPYPMIMLFYTTHPNYIVRKL